MCMKSFENPELLQSHFDSAHEENPTPSVRETTLCSMLCTSVFLVLLIALNLKPTSGMDSQPSLEYCSSTCQRKRNLLTSKIAFVLLATEMLDPDK